MAAGPPVTSSCYLVLAALTISQTWPPELPRVRKRTLIGTQHSKAAQRRPSRLIRVPVAASTTVGPDLPFLCPRIPEQFPLLRSTATHPLTVYSCVQPGHPLLRFCNHLNSGFSRPIPRAQTAACHECRVHFVHPHSLSRPTSRPKTGPRAVKVTKTQISPYRDPTTDSLFRRRLLHRLYVASLFPSPPPPSQSPPPNPPLLPTAIFLAQVATKPTKSRVRDS